MRPALKKLTDQHIAFIEYFIQTQGRATESAMRAGYSKATAGSKGHELKNDPLIKAEIERRLADQKQGAKVTSDAVIAELAAIAFANIDDFVAWSGGAKIPNPAYISNELREEIERELRFAELMSQKAPEKYTRLKELIDNPLIDTKTEFFFEPHRLTLTNSDKLTREQKAAVSSVTFKPGQFGDSVTVNMSNKLDALGKLANILGLNAPKKIEVAPTQLANTKFTITRRPKPAAGGDVSTPDTPQQ